jgi:hypothetical protein
VLEARGVGFSRARSVEREIVLASTPQNTVETVECVEKGAGGDGSPVGRDDPVVATSPGSVEGDSALGRPFDAVDGADAVSGTP